MNCWVGMHYSFNLSLSLSISVRGRVSIRFMIIIKMSIGLTPPILAVAWLRLKSVRADGWLDSSFSNSFRISISLLNSAGLPPCSEIHPPGRMNISTLTVL